MRDSIYMSSFLSKTKEFKVHAFCFCRLVLSYPNDWFRVTLQAKQMTQLSLVEMRVELGFLGLFFFFSVKVKTTSPAQQSQSPSVSKSPLADFHFHIYKVAYRDSYVILLLPVLPGVCQPLAVVQAGVKVLAQDDLFNYLVPDWEVS